MPAGEASVGSETGELIDREPLPARRAAGRARPRAGCRSATRCAALRRSSPAIAVSRSPIQRRSTGASPSRCSPSSRRGPPPVSPTRATRVPGGLDGEDHLGAHDAGVKARSRSTPRLAIGGSRAVPRSADASGLAPICGLKAVVGRRVPRGFESLSLRCRGPRRDFPEGPRGRPACSPGVRVKSSCATPTTAWCPCNELSP
jgi:hypothetical protein